MEENNKRLIVFSILAYAVGTFIFGAGLLTKTPISIVTFFIIAICLIVCSMLALYNNYKKDKINLYIFLIFVGVIFLIINSAAFINNLFLYKLRCIIS